MPRKAHLKPTGDDRTPNRARQTGKVPEPSGPDEWAVEPALPQPHRTPPDTEYRQAVAAALGDGQPRSRVEPDDRTAHLVSRRLRNAADKLNARLRIRRTPDPEGVKITFTAERKD